MTPMAYYQCRACRETWALSAPENAWRGYFLPWPRAAAYVRRVRLLDRARSVVGLGLLGSALLVLAWKLLLEPQ